MSQRRLKKRLGVGINLDGDTATSFGSQLSDKLAKRMELGAGRQLGNVASINKEFSIRTIGPKSTLMVTKYPHTKTGGTRRAFEPSPGRSPKSLGF